MENIENVQKMDNISQTTREYINCIIVERKPRRQDPDIVFYGISRDSWKIIT